MFEWFRKQESPSPWTLMGAVLEIMESLPLHGRLTDLAVSLDDIKEALEQRELETAYLLAKSLCGELEEVGVEIPVDVSTLFSNIAELSGFVEQPCDDESAIAFHEALQKYGNFDSALEANREMVSDGVSRLSRIVVLRECYGERLQHASDITTEPE